MAFNLQMLITSLLAFFVTDFEQHSIPEVLRHYLALLKGSTACGR